MENQDQTNFCTKCGKATVIDAQYCTACGYRFGDDEGQKEKSSSGQNTSIVDFVRKIDLSKNTVVIMITTVAALIAICIFCAGSTSLAGLLRGKVPHHGAFVRQFLWYKEVPTYSYGDVRDTEGNWSGFPILNRKPKILLWTPEIELSYLTFLVTYPDGKSDNLPFEQSSDGDYYEIMPSSSLVPGNLYCYVAGHPLMTMNELPSWCFTVR